MVVTGSLVIGDSVRGSLRDTALARTGQAEVAVAANGRFLADGLAASVAAQLGGQATVAPLLTLRGLAVNGERRANAITVCGVDERFWRLAPLPRAMGLAENALPLNPPRGHRLGARAGDRVLLRGEKPGLLPRDAPLSSTADTTVAMRMQVGAILDDGSFGRFSLAAAQVPTPTAFIDLASLQKRTGMGAIANLLLVGGAAAPAGEQAVAAARTPADALVEVRTLPGSMPPHSEVRAGRIFLDGPLAASLRALPGSAGVMTYFVNGLRVGARATPYSLVAAADWKDLPAHGAPVPDQL